MRWQKSGRPSQSLFLKFDGRGEQRNFPARPLLSPNWCRTIWVTPLGCWFQFSSCVLSGWHLKSKNKRTVQIKVHPSSLHFDGISEENTQKSHRWGPNGSAPPPPCRWRRRSACSTPVRLFYLVGGLKEICPPPPQHSATGPVGEWWQREGVQAVNDTATLLKLWVRRLFDTVGVNETARLLYLLGQRRGIHTPRHSWCCVSCGCDLSHNAIFSSG